VSSSEGPEVTCALEAGTYTTKFFEPALTYTVPSAGWSSLNRAASPGNFHLFPPGGYLAGFEDGTTDDITILSAVVAPGRCSGEPSTQVPATFDGLVAFLTANPHISVGSPRDVSIAGLDGKAFDITFVEGDGCPDGVFADLLVGVQPSHGAFGLTPQMAGVRLFLLRRPGRDAAFAIAVDDAKGGSDYGDGEAWFAPAQRVIDSLSVSG
jgi:hypothetical protein